MYKSSTKLKFHGNTPSRYVNMISSGDELATFSISRARFDAAKTARTRQFQWNALAIIEIEGNFTLEVFQGQPLLGKKAAGSSSEPILLSTSPSLCYSEFYTAAVELNIGDFLITDQLASDGNMKFIEVTNITLSTNTLEDFTSFDVEGTNKFVIEDEKGILLPTGELIEEYTDRSIPETNSSGDFEMQVGGLLVPNCSVSTPNFNRLLRFRKEYYSQPNASNWTTWLTGGYAEGKLDSDVDLVLTGGSVSTTIEEESLGEHLDASMNLGLNGKQKINADIYYSDFTITRCHSMPRKQKNLNVNSAVWTSLHENQPMYDPDYAAINESLCINEYGGVWEEVPFADTPDSVENGKIYSHNTYTSWDKWIINDHVLVDRQAEDDGGNTYVKISPYYKDQGRHDFDNMIKRNNKLYKIPSIFPGNKDRSNFLKEEFKQDCAIDFKSDAVRLIKKITENYFNFYDPVYTMFDQYDIPTAERIIIYGDIINQYVEGKLTGNTESKLIYNVAFKDRVKFINQRARPMVSDNDALINFLENNGYSIGTKKLIQSKMNLTELTNCEVGIYAVKDNIILRIFLEELDPYQLVTDTTISKAIYGGNLNKYSFRACFDNNRLRVTEKNYLEYFKQFIPESLLLFEQNTFKKIGSDILNDFPGDWLHPRDLMTGTWDYVSPAAVGSEEDNQGPKNEY